MPIFLAPFKFLIEHIAEEEIREAGYEPVYEYPGHGQRALVGQVESTPTSYLFRRLGAPVAASPSRTTQTNGSGRTPSAVRDSAHGFRSGKAPTARGKCPKGHYWSYKFKKCLKSKF